MDTDHLQAANELLSTAIDYQLKSVGDGDSAYYRSIADRYQKRAIVHAQIAQAQSLAHIAMHLGNIHQTLITPDVNREPATVADMLKLIAAGLGEPLL